MKADPWGAESGEKRAGWWVFCWAVSMAERWVCEWADSWVFDSVVERAEPRAVSRVLRKAG